MTLFDYLIIIMLIASLVLGFWRGVVGEVLTLAGWIVGFLVAKRFGGWVAENLLINLVTDSTLRGIAGWVAAFLGVVLAVSLVRIALRGILRAIGLGMVDRFFGVLFGLLRGGLLVVLAVAIGGMTPLPQQVWWKNALLSPYLEQAVIFVSPWLPDEVNSRIRFS